MPDIDDDDIAEALVAIAVANRRLWPPQTKYKRGPGTRRPLNATEKQTLLLLYAGADPSPGYDELAKRLALDETAITHAMRELRVRDLVTPQGAHPDDRRRRVQGWTQQGVQTMLEIVDGARPIVDELAQRRAASGKLWP